MLKCPQRGRIELVAWLAGVIPCLVIFFVDVPRDVKMMCIVYSLVTHLSNHHLYFLGPDYKPGKQCVKPDRTEDLIGYTHHRNRTQLWIVFTKDEWLIVFSE